MVTKPTRKTKQRKRHPVKLKVLEKRGAEILEKGEVVNVGPSMYLVPSMSTDANHVVRHINGLWSCDCPYFTSGHTRCKHICAVRIRTTIQTGVVRYREDEYVEPPQIRCPDCKMTDFHASTTYTTKIGVTTVYRCDTPNCQKRFTFRPGFKKRWYSDDTITDALIDAGSGHPPARIVERLDKNGIGVCKRTIRRWIDDYVDMVERFASMLNYNVGSTTSVDEVHIKTHPNGSRKKHYLTAALDNATRLIMSYEVTDNKSGYDATELLEAAIKMTGRVPDVVIADGLNGYKKGFRNAVLSKNLWAMLVADVGINGKHVNNNKRERLNGEIKECLARARGFRRFFPGLAKLTILYHNFIHKHDGLGGITPAEAAGVFVAGRDIFKTLIQRAALVAA